MENETKNTREDHSFELEDFEVKEIKNDDQRNEYFQKLESLIKLCEDMLKNVDSSIILNYKKLMASSKEVKTNEEYKIHESKLEALHQKMQEGGFKEKLENILEKMELIKQRLTEYDLQQQNKI